MEDEQRLRWLAISDWGDDCDALQALAAAMNKFSGRGFVPQFIISAGDNFYPSGVEGVLEPFADDFTSFEFEYWKRCFLKHASLRVPFYAVLGNHDYMGQWEAQIEFSRSTANPEGNHEQFFFFSFLII